MMAIKLKEWYPDHNIIYAMANTSKERSESLEFMNNCDKHFDLGMEWVEAQFNKKGVGPTPKVVKYKDLKRKGEVFEEGIKKLGIPSQTNKWCNRDMKLRPLKKYADSVFGKNNYSIAVGLRTDEMDRVRKDYRDNNVFYPLMDNGISKKERNKFWEYQPLSITIPAFKGNCDMCFAKSDRKLMTILKEEPERGDWWEEMINKYGKEPIKGKKSYNDLMKDNGSMPFYRGYKSIQDLVEMAKNPFSEATDEYIYEGDQIDSEEDCGSGCQVF
jgi:3'-phosphoadenosine 5'-phosphosulfate sulfotransferase (PAPS reductase)/FAD synthetase